MAWAAAESSHRAPPAPSATLKATTLVQYKSFQHFFNSVAPGIEEFPKFEILETIHTVTRTGPH